MILLGLRLMLVLLKIPIFNQFDKIAKLAEIKKYGSSKQNFKFSHII